MDSFDQPPADPWPSTDFYPQPPAPQPERSFGSIRRAAATLALSGMLLVVGGAAVAFAASPDPSASPAPAATSNPSGGTTAPGTTAPGTTTPGTTTPKSTHNCPNMGGGGTNRGTTPSPVTPTTPTAPTAPSSPSV
jgi:hypothetical protein